MLSCLLTQAFCLWAAAYFQNSSRPVTIWEPGLQVNGSISDEWTPCPDEQNCSCWACNAITNVSCKNSNLKEVPTNLPNNTVFLDLSGNHIENLGSGRFESYPSLETLILSQNSLTQIKQEAFTGLQKLKFLSLRNNSIRYNSSGFQPGIFKPLISLETLNIQQNFTRNDYRGENYDLKALTDLVKLKILFLDGMPEHNLGNIFQHLTSLQEINFNGKYGRCLIWVMTPKFFPSNTSLTHISIQNCEMNKIQAKSFQSLSHLRYLDLSYNEELTFSCMNNLTDGLKNTKLDILKLMKLHNTFGPCVTLTKGNLEGFQNLTLREVYLDSNRIAYVDETAVKYIPKTLETISVRDNSIRLGTYVFEFIARQTFSNLKKLILSDQDLNHYDAYELTNDLKLDKRSMIKKRNDFNFIKRHSGMHDSGPLEERDGTFNLKGTTNNDKEIVKKFKDMIYKWTEGFPIPPPRNFTYLDFSNNKIRKVLGGFTLTTPNNLTVLNMSRNLYWAWLGPFTGTENLTYLDLSWNFCSHMNSTIFKDMPMLETLNLSRNYLDTSLNDDKNGIIFGNQEKLITLDISDNKLRTLPINIFQGLQNLKELDLSINRLKNFDIDLSHVCHLNKLNLNDNQLETISKSVRDIFDHQAHVSDLALSLEGNNFKCDCANLDFLKWLTETPVRFKNLRNYLCYFKDGTHANLMNAATIYKTLEEECTNYTPVIITSTAALVLFISLTAAAMVYRYRWNLRYIYYMSKYKAKASMLQHHSYEQLGAEEDEVKNVNVSYADEECGFVRQKIYTELEVSRGLKLHLRHRDSPVDERYVCDNIMDAIESTQKTLIIMSKAYLKCKWSIFEMNMAGIKALKTEQDMLCVLLREEVPTEDLPLKIMKIIKDQEYIEYPGDDNLQDSFWDRLHDILTN